MVSIIIINYNGKNTTIDCLNSLKSINVATSYEIIIVDNASTDGSVEYIRNHYPDIKIIQQQINAGFGSANNVGANIANGEYLFFVNNDVFFKMDVITPLKIFLENNVSAGAVAPMLLNSDGTFQLSYGKFPSIINEMLTKINTALIKNIPKDLTSKVVDWVSFAAVMMRKKDFVAVGGFDERYFMYFEDADVCKKLLNYDLKTYYLPRFSLIHLGGKSWTSSNSKFLKKEYRKSQLLFYSKHRNILSITILKIFLLFKQIIAKI